MDVISYKTLAANTETINKEWLVIDAEGKVLGRLASEIAKLLRGKHKPNYTPHTDCGDNVIVINASKVTLTGKKWTDREYLSYTGYPGGQRSITPKALLEKHPHALVEKSVKGMLPKNKLGSKLFKNLHVYVDAEHPHAGQQPKEIKL